MPLVPIPTLAPEDPGGLVASFSGSGGITISGTVSPDITGIPLFRSAVFDGADTFTSWGEGLDHPEEDGIYVSVFRTGGVTWFINHITVSGESVTAVSWVAIGAAENPWDVASWANSGTTGQPIIAPSSVSAPNPEGLVTSPALAPANPGLLILAVSLAPATGGSLIPTASLAPGFPGNLVSTYPVTPWRPEYLTGEITLDGLPLTLDGDVVTN